MIMTHQHSRSDRFPWTALPAGFADYLHLEGELGEHIMGEALDETAAALGAAPATIIDLGAGTGSGTIALASRFPAARVHSLDISSGLLERLRTEAVAAGVAERVTPHLADLEGAWRSSVPGSADVVWASLMLHHVSDPAAVLRQAFEALRPGGAVVIIETTGPATFTSAGRAGGDGELPAHLLAALSAHGHSGTIEPSTLLRRAGFIAVRHRSCALTISGRSAEGGRYLATHLRSHRQRQAATLPAEELSALDAAIAGVEAGTSGLTMSSERGIWVAVRPFPSRPGVPDAIPSQHVVPGRDAAEIRATAGASSAVDAVVIGGGPAGLAAAIALARSRRSVVLVDAGQPRNGPAESMHNVLGHEGMSPRELLGRGRAEARAYGVRIVTGRATAAHGSVDGFTIEVDEGAGLVRARRVVLATGLLDDLPAIPGVTEAWGHSVLHCPFCHGWEARDQRIAVLCRDTVMVHQVLMFRQLSDRVTVFLQDAAAPDEEQREQLAALGVPVVGTRVERLVVEATRVRALETEDGDSYGADAVVVTPRYNARTALYEALGGIAETTPFGRQIPADPRGMTAVPGVWAAGNATQPMAMVAGSTASGVMTGSAVHGDLGFADLRRAVATHGPGNPAVDTDIHGSPDAG